jgi:hypothetical protein
MKKLLVIIIVLLLALIPLLSHAQQGYGTHPVLGQFTATLINKSLRIEYGSNLVILTGQEIKVNINHYTLMNKPVEHIHITYYGEKVASIVDGEATLLMTPWVEIIPQKASHD